MVKALVQPKKSGVLPTKGKSSKSPFARRPVSTESEGFTGDEPFSVSESVQPDWGSIPVNAPDATPLVQAQEETEEKEIQEKEDEDKVQLKESAIASSEDEDNKIQAQEDREKDIQAKEDEEEVQLKIEDEEKVQAKEDREEVQLKAEKDEKIQAKEEDEEIQLKAEEEEKIQAKEDKEEEIQLKEIKDEESVQTKLSIGKPGDQYEQEADRTARQVMTMPDPALQESVQRQPEAAKEEEKPEIQAKGQSASANANFEQNLSLGQGGGSPLGNETKDFMESRFNTDFSGVRVHTDSNAVQMNKQIGAQAFTHGKDVYFNAGKYNPGSSSGKELLAHELTHTIQQTGGSVQAKCEKCEAEEKVQRQPIAPSLETETVQAFGLGDIGQGIANIGEGIGDAWDAGTEWVGDRVEDLQELGEDAFPALVSNLSPELASLISNGGLGLIQEELESGLEGWMEGLFGGTSINETLLQFQGEIGGIFGEVQGLTEDSESNCEAFAQKIEAFRGFIQRLMDNPIIQTLQNGLSTITSAFQQVQDLILAPVFDTLMDLAGGVFNEVIGYAQTLWEWGAPIRDFLGKAWDWVLRQLGISGDGEGGIVNWIKEKASEIWTDLQERFAPVIEPLKTMLGVMVALSPAGLIIGATQYAPQLIESIQWLWTNKDNPEIIESAHAEMGHTILPQLLDSVQGFSNGLQSGVNFFIEQLAGVSESVLGLLGAVSGIPIVSIAQNLLQTISDGVSGLATWSQETLTTAVEATANFAQQVQEKVAPYAEVLSSLGVALINPGMIPMILAGNAWLIIPDCYKAPIIDLILDTLIGILSTTSELPTFGPIWQLLQTGILGFLEGVRAQETDTKVAISNKIAKIISGRSLDFILGFVQGLLKGIWEGISDPFVLAYQGITAIGALGDWVMSLISQPKQGMQPEGGDAIADSTVMAMMETGEAVEEGGSVDREGISQSLQGMTTELEPPATEVSTNFMGAVSEAFSGGEGLTYEDLKAKLGEMWASIEGAVQNAGAEMAQKVCEYLMQDSAEGQMGEGIGWLAGTIAFEVVLGILTAGTISAAKGAMKVVKTIAKILDWTGEALGLAFKMLGKLGGYAIDLVKGIGNLIGQAGGAAKTVLDAIGQIGGIIMRYADELLGKLGKGFAKEAGETGANKAAKGGTKTGVEQGIKESGEAALEKGRKGTEKSSKSTTISPEKMGDGQSKMMTGATKGKDPTPDTIREGSVRMEQHPQYEKTIREIEERGFDIKIANEARVEVKEIVDIDGNVIRVEKTLYVQENMRYLDLEHELGHIKQLDERFGDNPLPTQRVTERADGSFKASPNQTGILTEWQNTITEYHNRLDEFIRLDKRGASPDLLKEHADGIKYWYDLYKKKGIKGGRSPSRNKWVNEHFSDLEDLEQRYSELLQTLK